MPREILHMLNLTVDYDGIQKWCAERAVTLPMLNMARTWFCGGRTIDTDGTKNLLFIFSITTLMSFRGKISEPISLWNGSGRMFCVQSTSIW